MSKIIEAEGLTKTYPPSTKAVDGISFSVDEGEVLGFLGPNGTGKTTTMRILSTLASIMEGSATVAGLLLYGVLFGVLGILMAKRALRPG